eukprot:6999629-Pyramimonas_sp.AAC.1
MAGCAVVQIPHGPGWYDPGPKRAIRALGPPPLGMHQSTEGAEHLAVPLLLRHSLAPIAVWFDARCVFHGLLVRGPEDTCSASHSWACLWRMVWSAIGDRGGLGPDGLTVVEDCCWRCSKCGR